MLKSGDPFDEPLMDDDHSVDPLDLLVPAESSRLSREVVIKEPQLAILSRFTATSVDISTVYTTRVVGSIHEANGNHFPSPGWTCKMDSTAGAMAVADGELCVRRVGRLRVADASVMPKAPSRHTQIPVKMLNVIERLQD
jgi:choline dehydrogenase-like flavoprotein